MRKLLLFMLLLSLGMSFEIGDNICNRSAGESCMNSPDCSICMVDLKTNVVYADTEAVLGIEVRNKEPAELPLIIYVEEVGKKEPKIVKAITLEKGQKTRLEVKISRKIENRTFVVRVVDKELGVPWAVKEVIILGLEQGTKPPNPLIAFFGIVVFFGILYFGIREIRKEKSPYTLPPIYVYPLPPPAEEEIVIVPKKKKYYYRKRS